MTDMDAAERNVKKRLRQYVDAWMAPIVDRSAAVEELVLLILHAETVAREKGRQAGLEEGARAARSVRPGAIMVPSVSNIWHNGVRAAARAIEALKDKPEGGQ